MINGVLIRYGEIWLKKGRRDYFMKRLWANIRKACKEIPGLEFHAPYGRILVTGERVKGELPAPLGLREDRVLRAISEVFGIESYSPVVVCKRDMPTFETVVKTLAKESHGYYAAPGTFRVDTNRSDKRFPGNSESINRTLGSAASEELPGWRVQLQDPDLTLGVEIHPELGCVFSTRHKGGGGLPVGTAGRGLLLLSGGIDSPVAAWYAARRGLALDSLYFHATPYTSPEAREKVITLGGHLRAWSGGMGLYVAELGAFQKHCRDNAPKNLLVLLYRRQMMRVAECLARASRYNCLVTGESLGQVASQTVENMGVIESAVEIPVLRPLLCMDKEEIIVRARTMGTYETSILPHDDCCSLFVPRNPETKGKVSVLENAEQYLEWEKFRDQIVEAITSHTL